VRFKFSPKIQTVATFDFFNSIGAKQPFAGMSVHGVPAQLVAHPDF
jgi:hypothetical protein